VRFLQKPFDMETLARELRSALEEAEVEGRGKREEGGGERGDRREDRE
jgi:DNA-binding NtrC family response regulator